MKNKSFKRILSIILALVLTLGMLVVPAYAEDDNELEIISSVCVTAVTPTTISVKKINNVYYSLDNTTNWTTDATFAGLYPNTQHKVYYRFGTTGTPKELATVTTKQSESRNDGTLIDSKAPYTFNFGGTNPSYTGYITSFDFRNDLTLRYYLKADKVSGFKNFRLLVEHLVYDSTTQQYSWKSTVITAPAEPVSYSGQRYVFAVPGIAAKEVNDILSVTLYADDANGNTYISSVYSTSMADIAMTGFSTDSKKNTLLADFLTYCAAAQTYFQYNTADLATADLGNYASYVTTTSPTLTKCNSVVATPAAVKATFKEYTLDLDYKIALRVYPQFDSSISSLNNITLKVNYDSPSLSADTYTFKLKNSSYFAIDNILASDFGLPFTFTVYDGDTAISDSIEYSIENRCRSGVSEGGTKKALLEAMINYSRSAKAYFQN